MTHRHQDLETVRKACIASNPEIVELKFGCWVHFKDGSVPDSPITSLKPMSDGDWETSWGCFNPQLSASHYQVLGRPITLADVLLALEKAMHDDWHISLSTSIRHEDNKLIWYIQITHDKGGHGAEWNLRATLDDQSDETLSFLAELLR